jgi:hypothetical protein
MIELIAAIMCGVLMCVLFIAFIVCAAIWLIEKVRYKIMIYPCKDCEERRPACHGDCEKYLAAKEEHEQIKKSGKIDKIANAIRIEGALKVQTKKIKAGKGGHCGRERKA